MELELRARVNNIDVLQQAINTLPNVAVVAQGVREMDTYLKHRKDEERQLIFRIRRSDANTLLSLKAKARHDSDVLWQDIDIPLEKPDAVEDILMGNGYEYVVVIDKVRDSFRYNEYEINVDNVKDLGYFVEIAYESEIVGDVEEKLADMQTLLITLGCQESDIVKKGYVPLMLEAVEQ